MQRLSERSFVRLRLKPFAAASFALYLLLNAFLILCLIHPHNDHLQGQANGHLASICVWVHKTVSPHALSAGLILPAVEAALFILVPLPLRSSQLQIIKLTGRSPPQLALA